MLQTNNRLPEAAIHWASSKDLSLRLLNWSKMVRPRGNSFLTSRMPAIVMLSLLGLSWSNATFACLCPKPEFSASAVENTPVVIAGTVTAARIENLRLVAEVQTSFVWKGPRQARFTFTADLRNNCSTSHITVGGYYVFFTGESLELSHCTYTYQPGEQMSEQETQRRHDILFSLPHVQMDA